MARLSERNNFLYLTLALLVLLLALPAATMWPQGATLWLCRLLIFATLVVTYASLDFGRWWGRFVLLVLLLLLLTTLAELSHPQFQAGTSHLVLLLAYFASVAYSAARRVLLQDATDHNRIVGSIAIYLLLGLVWAICYLLILQYMPDALHGLPRQRWEENLLDVIYFSFVTLTTLGYGDIVPAHPASSALTYLEAICGPFYLAVVVASLVGARHRGARADAGTA